MADDLEFGGPGPNDTLYYKNLARMSQQERDALKAENDSLRKEVALLRGALIKTPSELHQISDRVKAMGLAATKDGKP